MRQPSIIVLLIALVIMGISPAAFGAIRGKIDYSIPVDYSKLSESELESKAKVYYFNAFKYKDNEINEDITNALMLYNVLLNMNPNSLNYCVKLGSLYDKLGMDKHAKGNFARAIGIDDSQPEPYFYYGEFYYKREMYRKALKYYGEAYSRGYTANYDMLYKMGDIYEKFGDTRSALKYLQDASTQNPNSELDNKIKRIETQDSINKEYYSNTRIRIN